MNPSELTDKIEVVSLDAGGTLLQPSPSVGHIYHNVATSRNIKPPTPEILNQRFKQGWMEDNSFDFSKEAWRKLVDFCFKPTCPDGVSDDLFQNIYIAFENIENWELFPEVELALEMLQQQSKMVVISSNWDTRLKSLLSGFGLEHLLSGVYLSVEIGSQKPDPQFYLAIAEKLKCAPDQILHVGDCPENDLQASRQAGFHSRLLVRQENGSEQLKANEKFEKSDVVSSLLDICNFSALPKITLEKCPDELQDAGFYHIEKEEPLS